MAIDKTVNLAPTTEETTTYKTSGSVSTRAFKILRQQVDDNKNTLQAQITVNADEIALKASKTYVDNSDLNLQSQITVNAGNINLKVSKNDVINQINVSTEGVQISASKLAISGYVQFTNLSTAGQTTINGGNIITGTLSADKIYGGTINGNTVNVINLNADNINAGSLSVNRLTAGTVSGWYFGSSTISRAGITLGADYISLGNTGTGGSTINLGSAKIYNLGGTTVGVSGPLAVNGSIACDNISADSVGVGGNLSVVGSSNLRHTYPVSNGVYTLGSSGQRWADVWCTDGAFNGSDIRLKKDIAPIDKGIELILGLNPVQWKWNWKEGRNHWGFIANELKVKMDELGIDGGVYADPKLSQDYDENNDPNGYLALRYTELIAPMVQTIQHLEARIKELENKAT